MRFDRAEHEREIRRQKAAGLVLALVTGPPLVGLGALLLWIGAPAGLAAAAVVVPMVGISCWVGTQMSREYRDRMSWKGVEPYRERLGLPPRTKGYHRIGELGRPSGRDRR